MKVDWNSKYNTISVYSVLTFAICLLMVIVTIKFDVVQTGVRAVVKTLSPIIWGIIIAYLLNPIMVFSERFFKRCFEKKKPHLKLCRVLSTVVALILGIAIIGALIAIIVPQVLDSLMTIFNNAQTYMNNIYKWVDSTLSEYPEIMEYVNVQLNSLQSAVISAVNNLIPKVGDWAIKIKDGAVGFAVALKDFVIGFIVAVYLLIDKEKFLAQIKKITTAIFPEKVKNEIFRISEKTNESLSGFISGKILDSIIIGIFCFIVMTIFKLDYPVLISTIVGVTNVIPFFGPFIGAIPSALLLLLSGTPKQTFVFIVIVVVLQQIDGNILGPWILGDSTGLPAFWVMFAIFVGGGLFGFAGMLLGVPIFAVIFTLVQEIVEALLKKKGLSVDTAEYYPGPSMIGRRKHKKKKTQPEKKETANNS